MTADIQKAENGRVPPANPACFDADQKQDPIFVEPIRTKL